MSDRAIVALGVWLLLLVLIGTATIGIAVVLSIGIGTGIATLAMMLFVASRRQARLAAGGPERRITLVTPPCPDQDAAHSRHDAAHVAHSTH